MPSSEMLLPSRFRQLVSEGQLLALGIERGQSSTPLAEHFATLQANLEQTPLTIAVVALTPEVRTEALAWLLGEEHRTVSTRIDALPGLLEIRLSDRSYVLETGGGQRSEFSSLQEFLEALPSGGIAAPESQSGGAFRVSLAAVPEASGATLLLPESLAATSRIPALANALISRSHLLLIATPSEHALAPEDRERLSHLAQGIGTALPVVVPVGDIGHGTAPTLSGGALLLAPVVLDDTGVPSPFVAPFNGLHTELRMATQAKRLQLAIQALADRHAQDLRQIQARRVREERSVQPDAPASDAALRRPFEQARSRAQDDLAALAKSTTDSSRQSLLRDGSVQRVVSGLLEALRASDLMQEPGQKLVRLRLGEEFQESLQRALKRALKDELKHDLVVLRDGFDALRDTLESALEEAMGHPVNVTLVPPSENEVWSRMGEMVNLEIRYRSEMPRRGFLQRLGEGRRAVFAVMMILSLAGSISGLSNWRRFGFIGILFLLMFIGVVIHTYRAWKREDAEKLESELERVREQLTNECKRLATEAQREKQQRLGEFVEQSKRILFARLDELQRERFQSEQEQAQEHRERVRLRMRKLDQQLREAQALGSRMLKLGQGGDTLASDAVRALRDGAQQLDLIRR